MRNPDIFIAHAPRGAGLRCAIAYLKSGRDVYGWFTGPRIDASVAAEFFLLEDFYSGAAARYEAVDQAALHSAWSLDEPRRHELAAMQEAFAHEWLVYRDGTVQVRPDRLARFSTLQPNWTYYSPGFERSVFRHLARRWRLEAGLDVEPGASP